MLILLNRTKVSRCAVVVVTADSLAVSKKGDTAIEVKGGVAVGVGYY